MSASMIAAALCLVGLGSQPIPSAGSEAVHGRPIQATGPLVIRDDSANGNIIATQLPVVSDLDSDNHIGW
ncbi:hypothetical protein [Aeromonas cavernicola]|uniref:hypothetical protein n=1 Tax=Aeromonas cavernicola TaxID=1006623 RepID=UPI0012FDBD60|nr:hypothetical protein [Aeromonas cavernicola]